MSKQVNNEGLNFLAVEMHQYGRKRLGKCMMVLNQLIIRNFRIEAVAKLN